MIMIVVADTDSVGSDMDYTLFDELGECTYYDDKIPTAKGKKVTYWIRAVAGEQTSEKSEAVTVTVK